MAPKTYKTLEIINIIIKKRGKLKSGEGDSDKFTYTLENGVKKTISGMLDYEVDWNDTEYFRLCFVRAGKKLYSLPFALEDSYRILYINGRSYSIENGTVAVDKIYAYLATRFDATIPKMCRNINWRSSDLTKKAGVFKLLAFLDGASDDGLQQAFGNPNEKLENDLREMEDYVYDTLAEYGNRLATLQTGLENMRQEMTDRIDSLEGGVVELQSQRLADQDRLARLENELAELKRQRAPALQPTDPFGDDDYFPNDECDLVDLGSYDEDNDTASLGSTEKPKELNEYDPLARDKEPEEESNQSFLPSSINDARGPGCNKEPEESKENLCPNGNTCSDEKPTVFKKNVLQSNDNAPQLQRPGSLFLVEQPITRRRRQHGVTLVERSLSNCVRIVLDGQPVCLGLLRPKAEMTALGEKTWRWHVGMLVKYPSGSKVVSLDKDMVRVQNMPAPLVRKTGEPLNESMPFFPSIVIIDWESQGYGSVLSGVVLELNSLREEMPTSSATLSETMFRNEGKRITFFHVSFVGQAVRNCRLRLDTYQCEHGSIVQVKTFSAGQVEYALLLGPRAGERIGRCDFWEDGPRDEVDVEALRFAQALRKGDHEALYPPREVVVP